MHILPAQWLGLLWLGRLTYSDNDLLSLAAYWADGAASKLVAAQQTAGLAHGTSREGQDIPEALYDGLQVLAENLNALTLGICRYRG